MKTTLKALLVSALVSASALAQSGAGKPQIGLLLAPKVGFFKTTTSLQGAFYAGGELGYLTPLLGRKLAVVAEASWHKPTLIGTVADPQLASGSGSFGMTERQVSVLLSAVYRASGLFGSGPLAALTPYGGLGPGLYLHTVTTNAFGSRHVETEGTLGVQVLAGAEYTLGPGGVFFEVHYHFTKVDLRTTGPANVGGFLAASLGYRLVL